MKKIVVMFALVVLSANAQGADVCSKYCNPERSKPCGNSCIPKANSCRKTWTTACVGERPESAKPSYTPKHVNQAPGAKK